MHCNALMDACIATLFNIQLDAADKGPMLQTPTKLQSHQQLREATQSCELTVVQAKQQASAAFVQT